jgi:hypothetical protein
MTQPGGPPPPLDVRPDGTPVAAPSKLTGGKVALIVVAAIVACGVPLLGVFAALSIYGVRKYMQNAKASEATHEVTRLATGIARCSEGVEPGETTARGLPESSARVPASLGSVKGTKYQSSRAEWTGAFDCAGFHLLGPQYFQYSWEKRSTTSGVATAVGDLDGDGSPETMMEQPVTCATPGSCAVGTLAKSGP